MFIYDEYMIMLFDVSFIVVLLVVFVGFSYVYFDIYDMGRIF